MSRIISTVLIFALCFLNPAFAGLFSMGTNSQAESIGKGASTDTSTIPIRDEAYKLNQKRREEARKLIAEGITLIKKGQKKNKQDLITKGQIKKEIGEKQLNLLKEQAENKKNEDQNNEW